MLVGDKVTYYDKNGKAIRVVSGKGTVESKQGSLGKYDGPERNTADIYPKATSKKYDRKKTP